LPDTLTEENMNESPPVHADPMAAPASADGQAVATADGQPTEPAPAPTRRGGAGYLVAALRVLMLLRPLWGGLTVFAGLALGVRGRGVGGAAKDKSGSLPPALGVKLVKGKPNTLAVPEAVRRTLGIRKGNEDHVASARRPTGGRPLVLPGSTA